jgi:hypothetical protein
LPVAVGAARGRAWRESLHRSLLGFFGKARANSPERSA